VSEVFLKTSSVYEDKPEVKQAVFETTGMSKVLTTIDSIKHLIGDSHLLVLMSFRIFFFCGA